MFTGLVEEVSKIQVLATHFGGARLFLVCEKILDDLKIGDSVAVNGTCLTVTSIENKTVCFDVAKETLNLTNIANLKAGDSVNLERAMPANGRFGGHIVSGHIDGMGKFIRKNFDGMSYIMSFEAPKEISKYIIKKGSICINGISLTIAKIEGNIFSISIIPHTFENTNLKDLKSGDYVNLETDIIAKYIEKFTSSTDNSVITESFLMENGF
jgi:riboflavin synthase